MRYSHFAPEQKKYALNKIGEIVKNVVENLHTGQERKQDGISKRCNLLKSLKPASGVEPLTC